MSGTIKDTQADVLSTSGAQASSSSARGSVDSQQPQAQQNLKPPQRKTMGRRTTSYNRLHRGQEFSVDDAEDEVDELFQPKPPRASGSLRRVPSTLRRRPAAQTPNLGKVDSTDDEDAGQESNPDLRAPADLQPAGSSGDDTIRADEEEEEVELDPGDDDADLSDAESFTLKDRQEAINETHPFGIRIWKPALYKKNRSVQKTAEGDIHSTPGGFVSPWLVLFNFLWTLIFGWWLAAIAAAGALICFLLGCADGSMAYGRTFWGLAKYLFYPFGKFVKFIQEEAYLEEDEGEGRSISEYEQWQSGDIEEGRLFFGPSSNRGLVGRRRNSIDSADETQSLLGRPSRGSNAGSDHGANTKRRLFGRGKWTVGRVVFFIVFYGLLTPSLFLVSGICWLLVFTIPMGRVTYLLFDHLRRHPLALSFHSDINDTRRTDEPSSSILLCTYRAVGIKYWKYTIDGTNIFLINLLGVVAFVIFDYWVLVECLGLDIALTNQFLLFTLALFSIIPLAYFIGQAVASISAQSSMGVGATINAFFSTIVEVFLYCVALKQGKAQLVEGSIIGSIFAGVLFLPGLSMCFGALKRKTQRFNVRSAGVTSTMLLFAVIAAFGPTLFYQIYGSHELNCRDCSHGRTQQDNERDCRRCYFDQSPAIHDRFYLEAVRPFVWFASVTLFLSYAVGLLFTLRTHAAVIWNSEMDEKKMEKMDMAATQLAASGQLHSQQVSSGVSAGDHVPSYGTLGKSDQNIRDSALYKRILGQSLKQAGLSPSGETVERAKSSHSTESHTPHIIPPQDGEDHHHDNRSQRSLNLHGMSEDENNQLVRRVAEMAATAAAVAARDATAKHNPRRVSQANLAASTHSERPNLQRTGTAGEEIDDGHTATGHSGGHDAPNWSRTKSAVILLTATLAYAIIAEILVNTVDAVLENVEIDEKFLGITLFALVPNTTEFLNAISFAMNGNIALSMEIGSAYALQVCLLQIPALVLYSAIEGRFIDPENVLGHTFTLIFPQWDMVTVILCVFLLSYMYGEGKSNYFKGSILILSYLVVIVGFYFSGYTDDDTMGINRFDTLALGGNPQFSQTFKTVGRGGAGRAY
ncbi:Low affinity vacuolar monovalent cation/H(+) antiporter [Diplodia seriata]|uniref:Low affinity vacuolar monovalent cation/H(+) antiporter n=1 Tax=Diplodia seriata TaxID=420778 RepID=A0A1S8B2R8_9PEZI|nr:Low affinity vacuolar monovalent cation/H(+) antiporter [Diplodia seriata]